MLEFYQPGGSWIHRADPRVKLAFAGVALGLMLLWQHPAILLTAIVGVLGLYRSAGLPWSRSWWVTRSILPVGLVLGGLRAAFYPSGGVLVELGPLRISEGGLAQGAALGLRLFGIALAVFLWPYTTEGQRLVRGLTKIGLPYGWGMSLGLALRFIPTIREQYATIVQAQRARGLDLEALRGLHRVRALLPGLVALMVSSLRLGEQLARALEARAFGAPGLRRTYLRDIAFRPTDWVILAMLAAVGSGLLLTYSRTGLGADPLRLLP